MLKIFENYKIKLRLKRIKMISINNTDFKNNIIKKTVLQSIKKFEIKNITISSDKSQEIISLIQELNSPYLNFSIGDSEFSEEISDYFLNKYGIPVSVVKMVNSGIYVYLGGPKIRTKKNIPILDILSDKTKYIIKNTSLPFEINSITELNAALQLVNGDISDILIKPCIIFDSDE